MEWNTGLKCKVQATPHHLHSIHQWQFISFLAVKISAVVLPLMVIFIAGAILNKLVQASLSSIHHHGLDKKPHLAQTFRSQRTDHSSKLPAVIWQLMLLRKIHLSKLGVELEVIKKMMSDKQKYLTCL